MLPLESAAVLGVPNSNGLQPYTGCGAQKEVPILFLLSSLS